MTDRELIDALRQRTYADAHDEGFGHRSADALERLLARAEDAERERDELQFTFDLRWKADMRAIKRWQEAHPGKERTWPDHADMVVWLLSELDALSAENKRLREALTPSGDTKAAYSGEFKFPREITLETGEEWTEHVAVPWTVIKEIMAAIRARAGLIQPSRSEDAT